LGSCELVAAYVPEDVLPIGCEQWNEGDEIPF